MTKPVRWTTPALQQLEDIQDYIAERNPLAAFDLAENIHLQINQRLPDFPQSGRVGRVGGTRELVLSNANYLVAYRVNDGEIEILALKHGAQEWSETFERGD